MITVSIADNVRENIRDAMERTGVNQSELARRSGVHRVHINQILNGKMAPTLDTCESLARGLGVRPDTIFLEPAAKQA